MIGIRLPVLVEPGQPPAENLLFDSLVVLACEVLDLLLCLESKAVFHQKPFFVP
jgi:hypothetical protein